MNESVHGAGPGVSAPGSGLRLIIDTALHLFTQEIARGVDPQKARIHAANAIGKALIAYAEMSEAGIRGMIQSIAAPFCKALEILIKDPGVDEESKRLALRVMRDVHLFVTTIKTGGSSVGSYQAEVSNQARRSSHS